MYISVKALRIMAAVLFAIIAYINVMITSKGDVPDRIVKKVGNISTIILIVMFVLGAVFGIFGSAD